VAGSTTPPGSFSVCEPTGALRRRRPDRGARTGELGPVRGEDGQRLRLASRTSPLARRQAEWVRDRLAVPAEVVGVTTAGDRDRSRPLAELGETGLFVAEVQRAVLDGRADVAVHSAKDLPARTAGGLELAAVTWREDPADVVVGGSLSELPPGARVATGSARRRAQLLHYRPDLEIVGVRGNLHTRLARRPEGGAVVAAAAALRRLGLLVSSNGEDGCPAGRRSGHGVLVEVDGVVAERLDPSVVLPQAGQGVLALECRVDDHATRAVLAELEDREARRCYLAERSALATLSAGCHAAVGAWARVVAGSGEELVLDVLVAGADGRDLLRESRVAPDPELLGAEVGRLLLDRGAGRLLGPPAPDPLGS
jgi:hydroxymethylbilane synthase